MPVLVGNCDGFVGNRMYAFMGTEAQFLCGGRGATTGGRCCTGRFRVPSRYIKVGDLSGTSPIKENVVVNLQSIAVYKIKLQLFSAGLDIGYRGRQDKCKQLGIELDMNSRTFDGHRYCPISDLIASRDDTAGRLVPHVFSPFIP